MKFENGRDRERERNVKLHAFKIKFNLLFKGKTPMKNLKVKTEERERE